MAEHTKHTPEPWANNCFMVVSKAKPGGLHGGQEICHTGGWGNPSEEAEANAERIVACVNSCAGISDPSAVGELVEAKDKEIARLTKELDDLKNFIRANTVRGPRFGGD